MPLIPFAFSKKLQKLVDVDEVLSGQACECICEFCKMEMLAKKGIENEHHFSHYGDNALEDCHYSYWVSIRSMARQILQEVHFLVVKNKFILNLHSRPPFSKNSLIIKIFNAKKTTFDSYEMELYTSVGVLYINFLTGEDNKKYRHFSYNQIDKLILEINLTGISPSTKIVSAKKQLYKLIVDNIDTKVWLNKFKFSKKKNEEPKVSNIQIEKPIEKKVTIPITKSINKLKDNSMYIENKNILKTLQLEETKLSPNQIRTINFMENFYNHCFRYDRNSHLTENFTILDKGRDLFFISYKKEFYCVADLKTIQIVYILHNTVLIEITRTETFEKISSFLDTYLKDIPELF